jgi:hypothetical protein
MAGGMAQVVEHLRSIPGPPVQSLGPAKKEEANTNFCPLPSKKKKKEILTEEKHRLNIHEEHN